MRVGAGIGILTVGLMACAPLPPSLNRLGAEHYPPELVRHMEQRGCRPDVNFLRESPFHTRPPFFYGYLAPREEDSAIMWCYRMVQGRRRNILLIMANTDAVRKRLSCPDAIETDFQIGGLSYGTAAFLQTLDGFVPLRPPHRSGGDLAGVSLPAEHIVSTRRGEVTVFACHAGEWWLYRLE